ncbi:hypothetical protein E2542_SST30312 [Spatholobus suberectus]|nr:hypothetical protein E2542_SST30312 [Spatholobus suberectus]
MHLKGRTLATRSFVGEEDAHNCDDTPSPASGDFPVASHGIVMVSPPDSQDAGRDSGVPQDVFHTPPEESSLPSSDGQRPTTTAGVDLCAVNHAVEADAGTQGFVNFCDGAEFVDLGRDSELGFSEVQLVQEIGVAECSCGVRGDGPSKIPDWRCDEFVDFERELSDLDESPVKKSKRSEHDLGVQLQRVEEGRENCEGKLVSESDGGVNLCESDKVAARTVEGNKSSDGVVEASGTREKSDVERGLRVLPSSMRGRLENAASEMECGSSREKNKCSVFDVLKVLSEDNDEDEDNLSLLEVARACGVTFPRPRWWPDGDNFNPQE